MKKACRKTNIWNKKYKPTQERFILLIRNTNKIINNAIKFWNKLNKINLNNYIS